MKILENLVQGYVDRPDKYEENTLFSCVILSACKQCFQSLREIFAIAVIGATCNWKQLK